MDDIMKMTKNNKNSGLSQDILKSPSNAFYNLSWTQWHKVDSSAYKYQDDNKNVKFLSGGLSIGKAGFEAKLDLVNLEINSLGLKTNLGVNTSTGVSISNNSIEASIGGLGVKVGKEIGISTSIGGVSIDIGTLISRNTKINSAGRRIKEVMTRNGMKIDMFNKDKLSIIVDLVKPGVLNSKEGALTNITDLNIKTGKGTDINTPIGDKLSNIEDSFNTITGVVCSNESLKANFNTITGVACSNESLKANFNTITGVAFSNENLKAIITSCNMKVGNETGTNTSIGDESRNIRDFVNTITDVLNSNENLDTNITEFGTKVRKEIGANIHTGDVPFNIEDLTNTFTCVISSNESMMANIKDCDTKIREEINK
ncbi:hypothetical protein F8M41_012564 [Gigaspora margarita]|uniref:Uncharacterized protein n=1 Tax=Gigaspora margarita TaxID=4874 RepID=A0A8H4ASZ9_GIGMA|nr:hypothetical protein F8M41_012564 [Gigaspora margarita]